jgi:presenilin-like A22 family membrane protease
MKHSVKITIILVAMFLAAQLVGIYVANAYLPETVEVIINETTGETRNISQYNLPYGIEPPQETSPGVSVFAIMFALFFAVVIMFILMRFRAETFMRLWFLVVVALGIALALNAIFMGFEYAALLALIIAVPLAILKIFHRNVIVHNITEVLIYPGIASVFIPLFNVWAVIILLILISIYDIYAVWHAGFMQKMAQYQIENLKIFSGFFVPYISKKDKLALQRAKASKKKSKRPKKVNVNVAILGGGDVVFPILLSGVVLRYMGLVPALFVALFATVALSVLFYYSEKGKFYPAMPFISAGCFVGLAAGYLYTLF